MAVKNRNFKISDVVWDEFATLCKNNGTNASEQLRNFVDQYIKTYHIDRN